MTKPLLACRKCGAETTHQVEFTGLLEAVVVICDPCWDEAIAVFEERRRQFQELLNGGMTREQANQVMIARYCGPGAA